MELMDKLKEARLQLNETAREYMGNWATRDAQFAVDVAWLYMGFRAGMYLLPKIDPAINQVENNLAGYIGLFAAAILEIPLNHRRRDRIRKNLAEYLRLVGNENAINRGSYEIRQIVREELGLPSPKEESELDIDPEDIKLRIQFKSHDNSFIPSLRQ